MLWFRLKAGAIKWYPKTIEKSENRQRVQLFEKLVIYINAYIYLSIMLRVHIYL